MPYRRTEQGEQRAAAMRRRLLDAARALFAERGVDATTVRQVVADAGTSIGNFYFYFADKEALVRATVDDVVDAIVARIEAAAAAHPPGPARLATVLQTGIAATLEHPELARVVLVDAAWAPLRATVQARFVALVERVMREQPALTGRLDPGLAALAWHGAVVYPLEQVVAGRLPVDPAELTRFLIGWNLRALGLPAASIEAALAAVDGERARPT